ncbi:PEP-CTERM sorting domain-containing protein [Mariniblastus fucicola]|uniref:Ice-binding protein C-terminal domain-containing protein n=1 Tax=Mariniblastus fucicola TaxID=980251 RepID=A0A5B9PFA9_9BACT|nr:PEP-CTERM sorting domain-containing protein [Mariniblastus fucicola]QEG21661.1 hypothetical protein MFFC18_15190 [Mariniblastus fucicola]
MYSKTIATAAIAAAFLLCICVSTGSTLAQSRFSTSAVAVGNTFEDINGDYQLYSDYLEVDSNSDGGFTSVTDVGGSWDGYDRDNIMQTMTLDGSAAAFADYGRIQTYASGTLHNTFYNPQGNLSLYEYDPEADEVLRNPDGVPNHFDVYGYAGFDETLQWGGTAVAYQSTYIFNLHGSNTGEEAFTYIYMKHGDEEAQTWFITDQGDFDLPIYSSTYVHGGAPQDFRLTMFTSFQPNTEHLGDGQTVSGTAAFDRTLELVGIDVRDENGTLLSGVVTGSSGTTYDIMAVPEPTSAVLLGLALAAVMTTRRRVG